MSTTDSEQKRRYLREFTTSLKHELIAKYGSLAFAAKHLGVTRHWLYNRFNFNRRAGFTLEDYLWISAKAGIKAGHLEEQPTPFRPEDALLRAIDPALPPHRLLEGFEPPEAHVRETDAAPSQTYHRIEKLWRDHRAAFKAEVEAHYVRCHHRLCKARRGERQGAALDFAMALDLLATSYSLASRDNDAARALLKAHQYLKTAQSTHAHCYLLEHTASILRRLGQLDAALITSAMALAQSIGHNEPSLIARCQLTTAVVYSCFPERQKLADNALLATIQAAPTSPYAYTAAVNLAAQQIEARRPQNALNTLDLLPPETTPASYRFLIAWTRATAWSDLEQFQKATVYYANALSQEHADPVYRLKAFTELAALKTLPGTNIAHIFQDIFPHLQALAQQKPKTYALALELRRRLLRGEASDMTSPLERLKIALGPSRADR